MSRPLALITGASAGMGAEYARQLAQQGYRLLLVSRNQKSLDILANEIKASEQSDPALEVLTASVDLACVTSRQQFYQSHKEALQQVTLLVANAGIGHRQSLQAQSAEQVQQTLQLNVQGLTELVQHIGQHMLKRQQGQVILVASIVAWMPLADYALYSASKAYVLQLGKALHYQWRRLGVDVLVSCPSTTKTEFFQRSGQQLSSWQQRQAMSAQQVCAITLTHLRQRKSVSVPGWKNQLIALVLRCLPVAWLAR